MWKSVKIGLIIVCVIGFLVFIWYSIKNQSEKEAMEATVNVYSSEQSGEIREYKWLVGDHNPGNDAFSEVLSSVDADSIVVTRYSKSYWMTFNVEVGTTFKLAGNSLTVTGIYPAENYITVVDSTEDGQ